MFIANLNNRLRYEHVELLVCHVFFNETETYLVRGSLSQACTAGPMSMPARREKTTVSMKLVSVKQSVATSLLKRPARDDVEYDDEWGG